MEGKKKLFEIPESENAEATVSQQSVQNPECQAFPRGRGELTHNRSELTHNLMPLELQRQTSNQQPPVWGSRPGNRGPASRSLTLAPLKRQAESSHMKANNDGWLWNKNQ